MAAGPSRSDSSEKPRRSDMSMATSRTSPPELQRVAVAQDLGGQLGAHVAAERLADEVAVAQGSRHVVHGARQHADLVAAAGHGRHVEMAVADAPGQLGQLAQRAARSSRAIAMPPTSAMPRASRPSITASRAWASICSV